MLKFFINRKLADVFNTNLAKWKRWSREFLPPDPLGGMQSGYARQYHPDQAFTVRLGGYLVAEMKYSIPEARQILEDLHEWLRENGFYFDARGIGKHRNDTGNNVACYLIFIQPGKDPGFRYAVRGLISREKNDRKGFSIIDERYVQTGLKSGIKPFELKQSMGVKCLNMTALLVDFTQTLGLDKIHYRVLV